MQETSASFLSRHQFLIRRLHSLSGLIPVGAYMVVHLATNASVLGGAATFQENVNRIHSLGPLLPFVEWTFIFIPILFHGIVGVVIVQGGLPNTTSYSYTNNIRYTLQRASGMIAFLFIIAHVLHLHYLAEPLQSVSENAFAQFDPDAATSSAGAAIQASWIVPLFYGIGVAACVYHLANGLWTMGITWGLWTSPAAQRRADYICMGFGVLLLAVGLGALNGFWNVDTEKATVVEQRMEKNRKLLSGEVADAEQAVAGDEDEVPEASEN